MSDKELKQACKPIFAEIGMTPQDCVREGVANSWGKIQVDPKAKTECDSLGLKEYVDWIQVCKRCAGPQ
jgi:hypothetical protein